MPSLLSISIVCLLCFPLFATVRSATLLRNLSLTDEDLMPPIDCDSNSTSSGTFLTFIASVSIRGCPVFIHRAGGLKAGRFVLEPTICISSSDALRRPRAHYDLLRKQHYFSFPVRVTDESMVSEIEPQLRHLMPKSVSFMEVTNISINYTGSIAFKGAEILWGPTEAVGHLRLMCDRFACQSLAFYLSLGQMEVFESIQLRAAMRVSESCPLIERTYPVTIASAPFQPIKMLQRTRQPSLRPCSDLTLYRALQLDNCTTYVYKRQSKKGHFVVEPLLCPQANFSLLTDYSLGQRYLKLSASVENSTTLDRVRSLLDIGYRQSIEFMKLWDADLYVSDRLSQWKVEPVRLSTDRKSAELRVYCSTQAMCELLGSVLSTEPVNFWRNIQWTAVYLLESECEFASEKRRFAFRMNERVSSLAELRIQGRWSFQDLYSRTVTRNGRSYITVLQRGCKTSNFQRYWMEYVEGFGDADNFWLGLETLHSLTSNPDTTMRVEMLLWNDTAWFAEYSGFTVGNSDAKYAMNYIEMVKNKSNLVFDAMEYTKGFKFSTRDVDNYVYSSPGYCSNSWGGYAGWWFRSCSNANPNGIYNYGETSNHAYSMWNFIEGYKALREFRMFIQF